MRQDARRQARRFGPRRARARVGSPRVPAMSAGAWAVWLAAMASPGCAGSTQGDRATAPRVPTAEVDSAPSADAATATDGPSAEPDLQVRSFAEAAPTEVPQTRGMTPPLPDRVEAGTIARADLMAVLAAGVPRFLRAVPVEPFRPDGRFVGWKLLDLFPERPEIAASSVVQPGDVVVRVNQHSLERPEQFKTVWDSLSGGSELVIDIIRGDQPTRVRYLVVDDDLGVVKP